MTDQKGFCIRSIKLKVPNIEVTPLENFDFSEALESVYPLLDIIFSFLNYNDLRTCYEVKMTWREVAQRILEKRNKSSWFTCYNAKVSSTVKPKIIRHSDNLNYNNVDMGIILYDFRRIKLNSYICVHNFYHDMDLSRKTVPEYLEEELVPQNINYCLISCPKVVSYFDVIKKEDVGCGSVLDGLFLPKIPKIRTAMFHCNPLKKDLRKYLESHIKSTEEVKCLLLFCTKNLNKSIYNLLKVLIPENNASSVAVGGGVIRGTKTFQQITPAKRVFSSNDTFCIVFLQEQCTRTDFNAFSFVIFGDDLSKEEFEEELLKFKKQIILRTNSVAFRVCCSAKIYSEEELVLFNKVFPNIPLLGMNADGEIGWNCLYMPEKADDGDGESEAKKAKHKYPKVQHQWSTILVLITWGPLLTK
ncbi:uncharacterized protein LOC108909237 [Anoplophora glabripennis]|uniref:uncharacterized protein LOC108909237 n=1 Tax=Anoplophora glabripennis TaxID=217634 RepID=UPI000874EEC7|nr:uncharacterized protein LOC108909237 [Anoplophora glabripennis]XP_023311587.1 uncharacterized protein LOC108909237 [Anoplophora glabripennis]